MKSIQGKNGAGLEKVMLSAVAILSAYMMKRGVMPLMNITPALSRRAILFSKISAGAGHCCGENRSSSSNRQRSSALAFRLIC